MTTTPTNVGTLATDSEYALLGGFRMAGDFASGVNLESIVIRAAEARVKREVGVVGEETEIEGEEYSVPWPQETDDIILRPFRSFMLRNSPVSVFTALKIVTARSSTDGTVTETSTIPRNAYHVELSTGIVRELQWSLIQSWPFYTLIPGTMNLLADYTAAAPSAGDAATMKLVSLMLAARLFSKFVNNRWEVASISFDGQSTAYLDCDLTKQEKGMLGTLKRGVFPSFH